MTIVASNLLAGLAPFKSLIERRVTIPILSHIRLYTSGTEAAGRKLYLFATDLDSELTLAVDCPEAQLIDVAVDYQQLHKIVEGFGDETISLSLSNGNLEVDNGSVFAALPTLPPSEMPLLKPIEKPIGFELDAYELYDALCNVSPAMSTEETRYYLNGICIERVETENGKPDILRFAATDGHRLIQDDLDAPDGSQDFADKLKRSILPRRTVAVLKAALGPTKVSRIHCQFGELRARFEIDDVVLQTKMIDGTFPDYPRVIPTDFKGSITVDADTIVQLAKLAGAFERHRALKFEPKEGRVTCESPHGKIVATLDLKPEGEVPAFFGANAHYIGEMLELAKGAQVKLKLVDGAAPIFFDFAGNLLAVLMPMKV